LTLRRSLRFFGKDSRFTTVVVKFNAEFDQRYLPDPTRISSACGAQNEA
jgi:hypothetical protein